MLGVSHHGNAVPFPAVPPSLRDRFAARPVALRAFGCEAADLDVRFASRSRPEVAIQVIACCSTPVLPTELVAALPVGLRLQAMLLVASLERPVEPVHSICGRCGEELEVDLPLIEVARLGAPVEAVEVAGARVRVPTGTDQLRWAQTGVDPGDLVDDDAPVELNAIEAALDEADPLIGFAVISRCPGCEVSIEQPIDLEELCLRRFAVAQARLITDLHRLAIAYGWSEREAMALPRWRRAEYLRRIEESPT